MSALLNLDDLALVDYGLLSRRQGVDGSVINQTQAHMTDLGIKLCQEIQKYHLETRERAGSES